MTLTRDQLPTSTPSKKAWRDRHLSHDERWSESNIQKAKQVWELTPEEMQELQRLKTSLRDVNHFKSNPHELVKYIRGPKGLEEAESIFRNVLEWRRNSKEDIENMLDDYKPPRAFYDYAPSALLQGVDNDGDPVYVERAGDMDGYGFIQRFDSETCLKDVVWRRELTTSGAWQEDYLKRHGHLPRQLTVIYDLKGLSSRHMKKGVGPFFKDAVAYTQDKYYGISKRMIIIRAPTIFRMVWKVAQNFFRPEVRKKMIFVTESDYLKVLDKYMDRDILPPCINPQGHGQTARGFPPRLDGGLIPDDLLQDDDYLMDDDKSIGAQTIKTSRSGDSSFDSSLESLDEEAEVTCSKRKLIRRGIFTKSLTKGTLMLSECGQKLKVTFGHH